MVAEIISEGHQFIVVYMLDICAWLALSPQCWIWNWGWVVSSRACIFSQTDSLSNRPFWVLEKFYKNMHFRGFKPLT